jgi:hypothetical protein
MHGVDPLDRENLEPVLGPHWALLTTVQRRRTRLFGLGGAAALLMAVAAPVLVAWRLEPSAFQVALVVLGALLGTLAVVRALARAQADRLRAEVQTHCEAHDVDVETLVAAARKLPGRLYFFAALWDLDSVDKK